MKISFPDCGSDAGISIRTAVDAAGVETAKTLSSAYSAVDASNLVWLDFVNPDPTIEKAKTKARSWDRAHAGSTYDSSPMDDQPPPVKQWLPITKILEILLGTTALIGYRGL